MAKGNILITGASTGIGRACTEKFVQEGYTVYGSVRKEQDGMRLSNEIGEHFYPLFFDVTDHTSINRAASYLGQILDGQGLKLLINNAGIAVTGPVELLDVDDFRTQYEVNYFGLIAVTKAFLPLLGATKERTFDPGKIINMSSVASKRAMPFMTPYSSSKAAVDSFTEGLRRELLVYGIDVVSINPGPVHTPIWDKVELNPDKVKHTVYRSALERFMRLVQKESTDAIEVTDFANFVFRTFKSRRPKTTDVVMKNKWFKYHVTRLFPDRVIDHMIKKMLYLKP